MGIEPLLEVNLKKPLPLLDIYFVSENVSIVYCAHV